MSCQLETDSRVEEAALQAAEAAEAAEQVAQLQPESGAKVVKN